MKTENEKQELKVTISGLSNTGKSTMMLLIEKCLKEKGFDVELSFKNHPDYSGENSFFFHQKEEVNFDEKVEAIKSKVKITLNEQQLKCGFRTTVNASRTESEMSDLIIDQNGRHKRPFLGNESSSLNHY